MFHSIASKHYYYCYLKRFANEADLNTEGPKPVISECTEVEFWRPSHEMGASVAKKPSRKLHLDNQCVVRAWECLWGPSNMFSLFALHGYLVRLSSQYCISTFSSNSNKRKQCLPTPPKHNNIQS